MKLTYGIITAVALVTLANGCSHAALERELDDKLAKQKPISSREELSRRAQSEMGKDSKLTEEQMRELRQLDEKTRAELALEREKSLKLRAILIDDISKTSANFNGAEVELIKNRLKEVENKRLSAIFDAIDQTNIVMGRDGTQNQKLFGYFYDSEAQQ